MTKKEMFVAMKNFFQTAPVDCLGEDVSNEEIVAMLEKQIASLEKRASATRKPSALQLENEKLKAAIVEYLTVCDSPKSIKELTAEVPGLDGLSNQRVTHLVSPLVDAGTLVRLKVKKVSHFTINK